MPQLPRSVLASLALVLILAGCAGLPTKAPDVPVPTGIDQLTSTGPTGVASCDRYLASYRACHRAAGIFTPGQLEPRYQVMRQSLLEQSRDPGVRPQLAKRCEILARGLREALQDRSCGSPASAPPAHH